MTDAIQIITTAATADEAQRIAAALVERRLVACAQVGGPITSTYWWQGKLESSQEWTCTAKTLRTKYAEVEATIRALHSYDEPEILALPVVSGSAGYLRWLADETHDIRVAPAEAPSREEAERAMHERPKLPLSDADRQVIDDQTRRVRFNIRELLATTTVIAIGLAGVRWLPMGWFAGLSGIVVLAMLLALIFREHVSREFRLVIVALIAVYLTAVAATLIIH